MGGSGGDPRARAKMPGVFGGLRCDWNRSWNFDLERDVPADGLIDPLRGIAVIPGGERPARLQLSDMWVVPISNTVASVNHFILWLQYSMSEWKRLLFVTPFVKSRQPCSAALRLSSRSQASRNTPAEHTTTKLSKRN
jgi:hypothetical protein